MTQKQDSALDLDRVVARFTQAEQALARVTGELESMIAARKQVEVSATALDSTSRELAVFSETLRSFVHKLEAAVAEAGLVLKACGKVLDGTQLAEVNKGLQAARSDIERVSKAVEERAANIEKVQGSALEVLRAELGTLAKAVDEVKQQSKRPLLIRILTFK